MKAVYISHPFGGKAYNLTQASKWVAWAAKQEGIAPMAPWIILGQYFTEEEGRTKGLEIDCCHVEKCKELWICGPKTCGTEFRAPWMNLSHGMHVEVIHAIENNVKVVDMRQYLEFVG